jgi:hypothetical protein
MSPSLIIRFAISAVVRSMIRELKGLFYSKALFLHTTQVISILGYSVRFTSQIFVITCDCLIVSTLIMRIECTYSVNTLRLILADGATVCI